MRQYCVPMAWDTMHVGPKETHLMELWIGRTSISGGAFQEHSGGSRVYSNQKALNSRQMLILYS